jgi:hypothetical protein
MLKSFSIVVAALLASASSSAAYRTRESFDFGWNYLLGDAGYSPTCDASDFTQNISGVQCYGLNQGQGLTPEECACSCEADQTCTIWQFDSSNNQGPCWTGSDCSDNVTNAAWISFERAAPQPQPPQPPVCSNSSLACSVGYNDASWRIVNTPHDFVVEGVATPTADRGHGYLPFNISWYRKHFTIDASLQGQNIYLDFDGVYRNSDILTL